MVKRKDIHFRICEKLLERFDAALTYEDLNKTEVLTHAIQNFCIQAESQKLNDVKRQYSVNDHLRVRIDTHRRYEEKQVDLDQNVISHLQLTGTEKILDIGCATGEFLIALQQQGHQGPLTGLDQSSTMIQEAKRNSKNTKKPIEWIVGNATKLPFPDHFYDWIVARHMLYHVTDVEKTVQGFRNIIRPNGSFLATTNSNNSLPRIEEMCNRMLLAFELPEKSPTTSPFCLENGKEILSSVFPDVEETVIHNALLFHEAAPIVNYIASMFPSLNIPDDLNLHTEMKKWLQIEIEQVLSHHNGIWRDPKAVAIYRCRK
ncbi:class I SAM-dependent methyltransferase [Bacillus sp. NPDC077411]|uniref:Class I SAM-dependent methyltransferase n=1 Tax=Bacillus bruguierae TaxID=3127667 RepID=A0ABU8FGK5_9BACI